ncbi:MAG: hypothetical protein ACOC2U_00045 [bacterium]
MERRGFLKSLGAMLAGATFIQPTLEEEKVIRQKSANSDYIPEFELDKGYNAKLYRNDNAIATMRVINISSETEMIHYDDTDSGIMQTHPASRSHNIETISGIENHHILEKMFFDEDNTYKIFIFDNSYKGKYQIPGDGVIVSCAVKLTEISKIINIGEKFDLHCTFIVSGAVTVVNT